MDDVRFGGGGFDGKPLFSRGIELGVVVVLADFGEGAAHFFGDLFDAVDDGEAVAAEAVAQGVGFSRGTSSLFEADDGAALLAEDACSVFPV